MSHETTVYGFIEGATFRGDDYRKLQLANLQVLRALPEEDEFPVLSRGMFSSPGLEPRRGTFRSQIIHFGGSIKGLDFGEVPLWIAKFEQLLRRLFWFEAAAHLLTEYIDGEYRFRWSAHKEVLETYNSDAPAPTTMWVRDEEHGERDLLPLE